MNDINIYKLEIENKQLKEVLHTSNKVVQEYLEKEKYCDELEKRIDKAIEYNKNILKENWYGGNEKKYAKINLEILGGKE